MTLLRDAEKSHELKVSLENIAQDDGVRVEDYTAEEVVAEAEYVLSLFYEGGTVSSEMLSGEHGQDEQRQAKKEVSALKRFIKKYKR